MADNPDTVAAFKKATQTTEGIAKAQARIKPLFDDLSRKIPEAIKAGDGPMILFYLKSVKALINAIDTALQETTVALSYLEEVEYDEAYLADHNADLEKLTERVSKARTELTGQYKTCKQFENQLEKGAKATKGTKEEAFRELAKFDKWIDEEWKRLTDLGDKVYELLEKAQQAVAARDVKALAAAQSALRAMDVAGELKILETYQSDIKEFLKSLETKGYDADTCAELKDGANDLLARYASKFDKMLLGEPAKIEKEVLAMKIAEMDVTKALKVLELDAKVEAKLAKVLKGPAAAIEKGLDALARELKLKTNGKQMLAALKKAGVL